MLELLTVLGLKDDKRPVVCLAGAGGKTTLLYRLCSEMNRRFDKTAAFTTTHIMRPNETDSLALIINDDTCLAQTHFENGKAVIAGTQAENGKITAPDGKMLSFLLENADAIVAEADGSRNLPIKYPSASEPFLLESTSKLFVVAGLSALGKPLCEVCHRWPLAMAACGFAGQHTPVTEKMFAQILASGYAKYRPVFILNQADDDELAKKGALVREELSELYNGECVLLSLQEDLVW